MDVYHNGNFRGGSRGSRLAPVPIQRTFLWEKQEILVPAVYVGPAGAVLDVCARIPVEDMAGFLKKWPRERRLALAAPEDYEQVDADNPGSQDFLVEMSLDGTPLQLASSSSINWYPESVFRMGNEASAPAQEDEWTNGPEAEQLMETYGCSRGCCWHFGRLNFNWTGEPVLSPKKLSLDFRAQLSPVTAGYFTTAADTAGQTVKVAHPATGQEYTVTLHECLQTRHDFADMGAPGVLYPEHACMLSYSVSPEISRDLFDIRDCANGDKPRKKAAPGEHSRSDGAAAVFLAGKSPVPQRRMAASSMYFEPVEEIRWRIVFQVRKKPHMEVSFVI